MTGGSSVSGYDVGRFRRDGFLRVGGFFHAEEVGLLRRVLERDALFWSGVRTGLDQSGNPVEIWITGRLGEDILGAFVRSRHPPRPVPPTRPHDPDAPPAPYTPLERWPRERITDLGLRRLRELEAGDAGPR